jgi:hypothetical protein
MSQQQLYDPFEFTPNEFADAAGPFSPSYLTELGAAYTIVTKLRPSLLQNFGTRIKLELQAPPSIDLVVDKLFIGPAVTSGQAWDFTADTAVTIASSASFTLTAGTLTETDEIAFTFSANQALIVAAEIASGQFVPYSIGIIGAVSFIKSGVSEADATPREASYTPQDEIAYLVNRLLAAP